LNKIYTKKDLDVELKKNKNVLALFYASWCSFCVGFVPTFNEKVASLGCKNVVHVLLDDYDNRLWDDYDIPAVPTIIFFEEGKVYKRLDARLGRGLSEDRFMSWIEELNSN
jgi:thiol-disulfide isomerase/thioredoxin